MVAPCMNLLESHVRVPSTKYPVHLPKLIGTTADFDGSAISVGRDLNS